MATLLIFCGCLVSVRFGAGTGDEDSQDRVGKGSRVVDDDSLDLDRLFLLTKDPFFILLVLVTGGLLFVIRAKAVGFDWYAKIGVEAKKTREECDGAPDGGSARGGSVEENLSAKVVRRRSHSPSGDAAVPEGRGTSSEENLTSRRKENASSSEKENALDKTKRRGGATAFDLCLASSLLGGMSVTSTRVASLLIAGYWPATPSML